MSDLSERLRELAGIERNTMFNASLLREAAGALDAAEKAMGFLIETMTCGEHGHLNYAQFVEAGGSECPLCLTNEKERDEARKVLAVPAGENLAAAISELIAEHDRLSQDFERVLGPRREGAWLPIESAPKDGTQVDLWLSPPGISAGSGRSPDCWFSAGRWWMYDETDDEQGRCEVHNATHWRPLPLPPQSQSAEER